LPQEGLVGLQYETSQPPPVILGSTPRAKRKLDDTGFEVPDSDDDDGNYGWAEEDDGAELDITPQSQWRGSEDIMLGQAGSEAESDPDNPEHDPHDEDL
jgi:hypothetical protein